MPAPCADPFNAMGRPIPPAGREAAFDAARAMGLDTGDAWEVTGKVARALEDDAPLRAQQAGLAHLDLTGYYRMAATMLAYVAPKAAA